MPHSISHSDACLRLFNKKWGIPSQCVGKVIGIREGVKEADFFLDNGPGGRKRRLDI
jgi:hypothetical protein